jgi:hypothetical protein
MWSCLFPLWSLSPDIVSTVFCVLCDNLMIVRLNNLVINRDCFPIYVNVADFICYLYLTYCLLFILIYYHSSSITISLQEESQHITKLTATILYHKR